MAQDDPADLVRAAEAAERELRFDDAVRDWQRARDAAPTSRWARRADARLQWLSARHDESRGWEPLEALARARAGDGERESLAGFAEEVESMPEGIVRRESLLLLAEANRRGGDSGSALSFYERLLAEPDLSERHRRFAAIARAELLSDLGRGAEALEAVERAELTDTFEGRELLTAERRRVGVRVAWAGVALALLVLLAVGRPWAAGSTGACRALGPAAVVTGGYVILVPALVAELYRSGMSEVFLYFGLGIAPLLALAVVAAESLGRRAGGPGARTVLVSAVLLAHASVAYLALERAGGLASFGL